MELPINGSTLITDGDDLEVDYTECVSLINRIG